MILNEMTVHYPRYICLPYGKLEGFSTLSFASTVRSFINKNIDQLQPDLIHSHFAIPDGYAGLRVAADLNRPTVCTFRGDDINILPSLSNLCKRLISRVISATDQAVSVSSALSSQATLIGSPGKTIRVIHNGCDTGCFFPSEQLRTQTRKQLGLPPEAVVLGFVGDLSEEKGIFELTRAYQIARSKYKNIFLVIVGQGMLLSYINEQFWNTEESCVRVVDYVPHTEMCSLLNTFDMFVFPSHNEGFPNVLKEAMAAGVPVIASDIDCIRELVEDGVTGLLVRQGDPKLLSDAIDRLIIDKELLRRLRQNGMDLIKNSFSWSRCAAQYMELYGELLDLKAGGE
jgi:hypothetical protein